MISRNTRFLQPTCQRFPIRDEIFPHHVTVDHQAGDFVERHILPDHMFVTDAHNLDVAASGFPDDFIQQGFELDALVAAGSQNFDFHGLTPRFEPDLDTPPGVSTRATMSTPPGQDGDKRIPKLPVTARSGKLYWKSD
jgi:hypothetical protein